MNATAELTRRGFIGLLCWGLLLDGRGARHKPDRSNKFVWYPGEIQVLSAKTGGEGLPWHPNGPGPAGSAGAG